MPLNIVYLDDEVELCSIFAEIFNSPDVCVTTFSEHETAIKHIQTATPDLIFVDFRLSGTTGDQVALRLDPNIPKVLVTGDLNVRTIYQFNRIFNKPFDIKDVHDFITGFSKIKVAG